MPGVTKLGRDATFAQVLRSLKLMANHINPSANPEVEQKNDKEHREALFGHVQQGSKYTIVEQHETAKTRKGGPLLQVAFESRYRLESGKPFYHTFDEAKRGIEKFHKSLSGIHGDLNENRKFKDESNGMTVGVELEVKAKAPPKKDTFRLTPVFPGEQSGLGGRIGPGSDDAWNALLDARPVLCKNANISLTCEVSSVERSCHFEFITQELATQNTERFQKSTNDMLFVAQHLWHYINCIPSAERRTIEDFVLYYNGLLKTEAVSSDTHPPLEIVEHCMSKKGKIAPANPVQSDDTAEKLRFLLPAPAEDIPQLDPQVTFTLPLERVQAFYRSSETLFSLDKELQDMRASHTARQLVPVAPGVRAPKPILFHEVWNVRKLELTAVTVGNQLVDGCFLGKWLGHHTDPSMEKEFKRLRESFDAPLPGTDERVLQKLRGLFTLIALFGLTERFFKVTQLEGVAHSDLGKNHYGFLPKSSLYQLIRKGLNEADRDLLRLVVAKKFGLLEIALQTLVNNIETPTADVSIPPKEQGSKKHYRPVLRLTEPMQGVVHLSETHSLYPFLQGKSQGPPCGCSKFAKP
ncbi:hypothetical protein ACN469_14860 [Corallococcus terminator]